MPPPTPPMPPNWAKLERGANVMARTASNAWSEHDRLLHPRAEGATLVTTPTVTLWSATRCSNRSDISTVPRSDGDPCPPYHLGPEQDEPHAYRRAGEPDPQVVPAGDDVVGGVEGESAYKGSRRGSPRGTRRRLRPRSRPAPAPCRGRSKAQPAIRSPFGASRAIAARVTAVAIPPRTSQVCQGNRETFFRGVRAVDSGAFRLGFRVAVGFLAPRNCTNAESASRPHRGRTDRRASAGSSSK